MFKTFASALFATVAVAQNQEDNELMMSSSIYQGNMQLANDLMIQPQAPTMKKEDVDAAIKEAVEEAVTPPTAPKDIEEAVANGIVRATEELRNERKERWAEKKEEWKKTKKEIKAKMSKKKDMIKKAVRKIEKKLKIDRKEAEQNMKNMAKDAQVWWDKKVKGKSWAQKAEKRFESVKEDMTKIRNKMDKKKGSFRVKVNDWLSENGFEEFAGANALTVGATAIAFAAMM